MMKPTPLRLLPFVVLFGLSAHATTVVVNMDRVFTEFHKTREAEMQIQGMVQQYRTEQEQAREEFQAKQEAFNHMRERSANMELNDEQRREMAQQAADMLNDIRAAEERFRQEDQNRQRQIEEQGRRMRQRIVDEILEKVRELSAARNWALVLDSSGVSASGIPIVLRAANNVDVTGEVIQALNAQRAPTP